MSDQSLNQSPGRLGSASGQGSDPEKMKVILVQSLFVLTLPMVLMIVILAGPPVSDSGAAQSVGFITPPIPAGEMVYRDTCMVCHGPDAKGVVGLGKPLVNSAYVQASDDEELFRNIAEGRLPEDPANTSGMLMPARGAKGISDEQIHEVMGYLRTLQDPSQPVASIEAWIKPKPEPTDEPVISSLGRDLFIASCSACHGPNGEGMEGLGKPFTTSQFVKETSDKDLLTMIKMGRPIWDAANTTGVDMPPKGGNPAISDDELNEIITYIRSIDHAD